MLKPQKLFKAIMTLVLILIMAVSCAYGASRSSMPPGVRSFAPTGTVPENVSFRAVFNNPVVNRNQLGKALTPENDLFPFQINPPLQIEGRWQNDRTFTARLLSPLRAATTYTATLKDNLKDRRGNRIGPGVFRFQTEGISPTDIKASMGKDGRAYFNLMFNLKVNPAQLKGFLRILNSEGKEMPYSINGALPSRTIRAAVPVNQSSSRQKFTVSIAAGMKTGEGDITSDKEFSETVILDPELMVNGLYPSENEIRASFNFDIDPQTAKSFITVEPAVSDLRIESSWNEEVVIMRSSEFKPRNRFVITFRKGFPSKSGLVLKEDYKQAVIMPDLESLVTLPASGVYLTAMDKGLIPVELRNVKKLQLDLWRMYENNIPYILNEEYDNFQRDIAKRVYTKEIALDLPLNEKVRRAIPIEEIAKGERGLFLLTAKDSDREEWYESEQMINLSDIGAAARLWEDAVLIWANTLTTARGIPDAEVKIYSDKKQLLVQGKTDNSGVFYYELPNGAAWDSNNQPELAIITKGSGDSADITYIQLTRNLLNREIFDTSGREWLRSGYDAVIFSPRDIYRTGETAQFKAIVRNADMTTPEAFPVLFVIRDSLNRKVKQETIMLNAKGSAVSELNIPSNALTGTWRAEIAVPGQDKSIASYRFHVEDFAPPRIEVKLNTYKKFLLRNDTFTADIYARWLFGVDGSGLQYKATWIAREGNFEPSQERWKGYSFGDPSRSFSNTEGEIAEGNLDNFGAGHANLNLEYDWQAPTTIDVTIKAEVMDDSGRWVTNTITRPYYSAPYILGIAQASEKTVVRTDIPFKIAAVTPEEEPADPGELNAELYKIKWNYNMVEIDGRKRWQSSEELVQVDEKTLTLRNGTGEISFRPEEYGSYMVRVSDAEDNARAVYRFYASSPNGSGSGSQLIDRVEMSTEKDLYKLGETAKIKAKFPFEGLALITVENAKMIHRKVQLIKESEITFEIPVTKDFIPNAWITAWLIRPVDNSDSKAWASHRAIGLTRIKTDMSDLNINVAIDAPKKIEPASKLPVTIKLTGKSQALSAASDVAIAFVDDGVLALTKYKTPDLMNHFWGFKKLNSQGFDIYDQLIPVEDKATEQLHPGGDEAMDSLAGNINTQRFKILSLFNGVLEPDDKGVIHAELDVPEFSGRGKLFVVAAAGRSFGKAEQTIEIARDIVTETGLPRFAAPGDSFMIPISVFNTSNETREVKVNLIPEGLMLNESYSALKILSGAKESFNVTAKALGGAEKAILRVVTSWNENNSERSFTQEIEMPVRYAWPMTTVGGFGTFENGITKLELPFDEFDGDVLGSLTLADTPAVNLNKAVNFLNNYPYGCLEQTISGAWPFLILPDAVAELDPLVTSDSGLKERTDGAISRIQSMQLYDGSFTAWPGGNVSYNWGSVYAAHFLLTAKNTGINFPEEMLTGVFSWMRQFLASMPAYNDVNDERDDLTTKAYAVYVLALNGEKPLGWIEYLRENQQSLRPSGNIYLAGAQALIDGRADALRDVNIGSNPGYSGTTLESDTRNTAALLSMWLDVEPQAPEVTELAMRLVNLGNKGSWFSTQDNSAALTALARYNVESSGAKSEIKARLNTETSDHALLTYESNSKPASVKIKELPKVSGIQIEANGTGKGCYSWSMSGYTKAQPKPERRNINIECSYFDEKGNAVDLSQTISHGTVIQVVLTIKPSMTVNNLAVSYLLPAGFELENPRIEDGADNPSGTYGIVNDIRDDRLNLFFGRINSERSYGFKMRAVTRGTFNVPQVSAFGMYDSSIRFTGQPQKAVVIK